jgi:hypothetical protein
MVCTGTDLTIALPWLSAEVKGSRFVQQLERARTLLATERPTAPGLAACPFEIGSLEKGVAIPTYVGI